ncbi:unnamed protein product [Diamesa serratosioi]
MNFYKVLSVEHLESTVDGTPIELPVSFHVTSYLTYNSDFLLLDFPNVAMSVRNLKVLEVTFSSDEVDFIKRTLSFAELNTRDHGNVFDPCTNSDMIRINTKSLMLNNLSAEAREIVFKVQYLNGVDNVTTECAISLPLLLNRGERSCIGC